jgi:hypothetical protein
LSTERYALQAILAGVILVFSAGASDARQTVVIGSLGMGYDFWDRSYDDEGDERLTVTRMKGTGGNGDSGRKLNCSPSVFMIHCPFAMPRC